MSDVRFEWNSAKAESSAKKHGVGFDDARSVFADYPAKLIGDPDQSDDEDQFILRSLSASLNLLVVCHCYRRKNNIIHIIPARKATNAESKKY